MSVTSELVADCDWQDLIDAAVEKHCHEYARVLFHKAKAAKEEGHECADVYRLISDIAGLHLDLEDSGNPFRPEAQGNGWRTFALDDLDSEQRSILRTIGPTVRDAEIRARICDVAWTLDRKQHQVGRIAIASYIASAQRLAVSEAPSLACDNITRSVQIAAMMGRNGTQYSELIASLQALVERDDFHESVIATIIEQLLEQKAGDALATRCAGHYVGRKA